MYAKPILLQVYSRFNTSTGISIEQSGHLTIDSNNESFISVEGYYAYTSPNSAKHTVRYTANEQGYGVSTLYIRNKIGDSAFTSTDKHHLDNKSDGVLEKWKNGRYTYSYIQSVLVTKLQGTCYLEQNI